MHVHSLLTKNSIVVVLAVIASLTATIPAVAGTPLAPTATGFDISFPQCTEALPPSPGFGVVGVNGVIVTPHVSGMYQKMIEGARAGIAAATNVDFIIALAKAVPSVGSELGIQTVATVFAAVAANTPLGWALAGAAGAAINLLLPAPDPNEHGGIHADRTTVGPWESFILSEIPPGSLVTVLSWQGLFSAQNGGGGDVFANRPQRGPWETWALLDNHDGTVSLKSTNGPYLTATNGGGPGSYCVASAPTIGPNEKFHLENLPNGHIALKTAAKGTYLSVQSGK